MLCANQGKSHEHHITIHVHVQVCADKLIMDMREVGYSLYFPEVLKEKE